MSKNIIINPLVAKGEDVKNRIKELMAGMNVNENTTKSSVIELTKIGPDGHVYAIVRENHEYFIKTTNKTDKLTTEDFNYLGGLQNKKEGSYPTYAKAIKQLNLKFSSLNEAYGKNVNINVFENDNLITESGTAIGGSGFGTQSNLDGGDSLTEIEDEEEEKLTEIEQAVHEMGKEPKPKKENKKLSIATAIEEMDSIIDDVEKPKKKVYTLK